MHTSRSHRTMPALTPTQFPHRIRLHRVKHRRLHRVKHRIRPHRGKHRRLHRVKHRIRLQRVKHRRLQPSEVVLLNRRCTHDRDQTVADRHCQTRRPADIQTPEIR